MVRKLILVTAFVTLSICAVAQQKDTVIVNLARTSKIVFTVEDPEDLEVLKHYDFQRLFEDVLTQFEQKKKGIEETQDSVSATNPSEELSRETTVQDSTVIEIDEDDSWRTREGNQENDSHNYGWGHDDDNDDNDDDDDRNDYEWHGHGKWNRTWQSFNFDLGLNNYLEDGKFPSGNATYAVRPWGSWYVGLASVQRTKLARKFFLEWGLGMSWYTFKYEEDNVRIMKDDDGVEFVYDTAALNFQKSKLSMSFVQASLIPVVDFGDHSRKPRFWDGYDDHSFRVGLGPYIAYRISSHSKVVYDQDGKEKDKEQDNFYLNNLRYGIRLQIGYRGTDLFVNYDLNELFQDKKGPEVNAFSFGVIF